MLVKLLEDKKASLDGVTVVNLAGGEIVDAPDDVAARWLERGVAVAAAKDAGAAPENKTTGEKPSAPKRRARRSAR